jgi:hypothetical protein
MWEVIDSKTECSFLSKLGAAALRARETAKCFTAKASAAGVVHIRPVSPQPTVSWALFPVHAFRQD